MLKVDRSGQRRLGRFHGQTHQVFDPALVYGHIERDLFPGLSLSGDFTTPPWATMTVFNRCAVTGCSSVSPLVPSTVALKTVSRSSGMPADGDGEVGSRGLAFDFNFLQHAAKLAGRRQDAADSLEHSQVSLVEGVFSRQRCLARIVGTPWAESSLGFDFSRRNGVGELRVEFCGTVESDRMHHQVVNGEYVGIFVRRLGQQAKFGVVRNNFSDQHRERLRTFDQSCFPLSPLGGICITSPFSLTWSDLPRLSEQSQDAGLGGELAD